MSPRRILSTCAILLTVLIPRAQVNLQTGSAVFSLPMFNWQDDKSRLTSMVALGYSSGNGLRVNDIASNAGHGWDLVAGGVITRMQVGEPDDQRADSLTSGPGAGTDQDISRYPNGFLNVTTPVINGCPQALTKYPIYGSMNQYYTQHNLTVEDRQMDYFSFQFNGKAGLFVLDTAGGGAGQSLGDTRLLIKFQKDPTLINQGIRTTITSFTIQDVDGLIYKFAQHGLTEILHADYCDADATQPQAQPTFKGDHVYHQAGFVNSKIINPYIIGSWYLSEISDPLTGRKMTFTYVNRTVNNIAGTDISYNLEGNYSIISHKTSISTTPEISSIAYPDGHAVAFNYGAPRVDLNGEYALASVDISYQGRFISKYILKTSYFLLNRYGTPVSYYEKSISRLCLRSVKKIGVDLKEDSPPYIFDYFLGSDNEDDFVPPPFFYAKDIWGFYNGDQSVAYDASAIPLNTTVSALSNNQLKGLCFLNQFVSGVYLNPKHNYAQNGLLKQIIFPTGGTLNYQYDQNTGVLNGSSTMVGGVHVALTSSTDGGYSNGCSNPLVTQYNYVINGVGSASSLWGLESPTNAIVTNSHYAPEWKSYHWTLSSAPFGECYWHFKYPGILSQLEAIDLTGMQKAMQALAPVLGVITVITDIMDAATIIGGGSGFFVWAAIVVDVIGGLLTLGLSCFTDNSRDKTNTTYYNFDLNGAAPLPTQFKRVEIVENPGTIGKTVQEFTSSDDYAVWVPSNPDYVALQRFAPWAYGLPKQTSLYDASGNLVKQTLNVYDFTYAQELIDANLKYIPNSSGLNTNLVSCKCLVTHTYSQRNTDWGDPNQYDRTYFLNSNGDLHVDFYGLYSGRVQLAHSHERVFKTTDATKYVERATYYQYNFFNYEVSQISVTKSNGESDSKNFLYTSDFASSSDPALQRLVQNNVVALPVSTYNTVYNPAVSYHPGFMNERVTEFTQLANGDIRPGRTLEQRFAQPSQTASEYSPDNPNNASLYKVAQTFMYDGNSNLVGMKDEGSRSLTNMYDYDDKYVVASIINADPLEDRSAYTSFETSVLGNWVLNGPLTVNGSSVPAVTGTRTFALLAQGGNSLTAASLNSSRPYILSFWASNSNVSVSAGASLVKSAPTINGYTYYEYGVIRGTLSITLTNATSANVNIDELRIYPSTAKMQTTAYDPLIGKITECDENNRITYYEYDNLGRLRFVKDEYRNIVKMHEYNNVSPAKQNGCPGTYANHLVTELFTKSCGTGYVGTDVPYIVPAGRYTSSLSQEDADAQAEIDLLVNGPITANNGGTCRLIYYNPALSLTVTTQSCGEGLIGGAVTYTVPAGRYSSLINQQDATQKAMDDTAANAQAYANSPDHAVCSLDTDPDWNWEDGGATKCLNVNGVPHTFVLATDINPNSPTYGQTTWKDFALSPTACPVPTTVYARLDYENLIYLADGTVLADVVVRFYSDPGGTQPVLSAVALNYEEGGSCGGANLVATASPASDNFIVIASEVTIEYEMNCPPFEDCPFCDISYFLDPGNGYTVIY